MDELRKLIRALFPQAEPRKFGQALQARIEALQAKLKTSAGAVASE